jgi:signal peptidase
VQQGGAGSATKRAAPGVLGVAATIITMLVFALLVVAILLAVSVRNGPYGERTIFGHPVFVVASGSMVPTFSPGDLIYDTSVSLSQAEHLRRGQIISFVDPVSPPGGPAVVLTHRIYSVGTDRGPGGILQVAYRTKGDANRAPDATPVPATAVLGVYQGRIPLAGYVLDTLHQPITFVILVMIPVVYLVVGETRRRWVAIGAGEARQGPPEHPSTPWGPGEGPGPQP